MRISDWSSDVCSSDLAVEPNRDLAAENNPATALNDDGRCVVGLFRLTGGARPVIGTLGKRSALPFPLVVAGIQFGPLPTLICCRSEEHTSELQSLMRISYAVFCLKKKTSTQKHHHLLHYENLPMSEN